MKLITCEGCASNEYDVELKHYEDMQKMLCEDCYEIEKDNVVESRAWQETEEELYYWSL